jgi:hypothetical protein
LATRPAPFALAELATWLAKIAASVKPWENSDSRDYYLGATVYLTSSVGFHGGIPVPDAFDRLVSYRVRSL